ncbi:thrombospondin type 3 repeat-containing protein [bacterium]|nr:thrombospondin type 3 repeat-containing protein [bacterium]
MRKRLPVWSAVAFAAVATIAGVAGAAPSTSPTIGRIVVQDGTSVLPGVATCADDAAQAAGLTSGWLFIEDSSATQALIDTDDAPWIAPVPAGKGALEQVTAGGANARSKAYWIESTLQGLPLGSFVNSLNQLTYRHLEHSVTNPSDAPTFVLFVDRVPGVDPTFDDVLVYVPSNQPTPCLGALDDWTTCNVLGSTVIPLSNSVPTTLAAYISAHPGATLAEGAGDAVMGIVTAGTVDAVADLVSLLAKAPSESGLDQVQVDFEKDCSFYGGDSDGDCLCDSTGGGSGAGAFVLLNGDTCVGDPAPTDVDGDGICGYLDNCATVYNPDQGDVDGDAIGDACDNCYDFANTYQDDTNGNGIGDACEVPSLSLRLAKLTDRTKTNGDAWVASGELDATASPEFLDAIDTNGMNVQLRNASVHSLLHVETFTGADCVRTTKTLGSIRCKNANGSRVSLAKRSATEFFKFSIRVGKAQVSSQLVGTDAFQVLVVSPVGRTRGDDSNTCTQRGSGTTVTVCKKLNP